MMCCVPVWLFQWRIVKVKQTKKTPPEAFSVSNLGRFIEVPQNDSFFMAPFKLLWFKGVWVVKIGTLAKTVSSGTGYIKLLKNRKSKRKLKGHFHDYPCDSEVFMHVFKGKSQEKIEVEGKLPRNMIPFIQIAGSFMCK